MDDDHSIEQKKRQAEDGKHLDDVPDIANKRSQSPNDCLDWDMSDEEEFTLYTQGCHDIRWPSQEEKATSKKRSSKNSLEKGKGKGKGKRSGKSSSKVGKSAKAGKSSAESGQAGKLLVSFF
jgi:hypothetical protein